MKILFVGGGNMAQAILGGLIAQKFPPDSFSVVEPVAETRAAIAALGIDVHAAIGENFVDYDAILLAVKPQMMSVAIAPLAARLTSQIIISIAAGINTTSLGRWLGSTAAPYDNIVRAMPNTPALIRAGITGLYASPGVNKKGRQIAESLLGAVGKTEWFDDETMLDAVTAVSGSGPAYVFYFIEALEEAALELGFEPETARTFAIQTFLGSTQLVASTRDSPALLRARVTSKRGTTERAIETFDERMLKNGFIDGVKAAAARSRQLGEELCAAPTENSGAKHG